MVIFTLNIVKYLSSDVNKPLQGSHSDWKTWKKWEGIFQSGNQGI